MEVLFSSSYLHSQKHQEEIKFHWLRLQHGPPSIVIRVQLFNACPCAFKIHLYLLNFDIISGNLKNQPYINSRLSTPSIVSWILQVHKVWNKEWILEYLILSLRCIYFPLDHEQTFMSVLFMDSDHFQDSRQSIFQNKIVYHFVDSYNLF